MKKTDSAGRLAALILGAILLVGAGAVYTADVLARGKAIGTEYAVQFARIDAGVPAENVIEQKASLVRKQGGYVYEVDFSTETGSFEYVVRASDGVILKREGDFESLAAAPTPAAASPETPPVSLTPSAASPETPPVSLTPSAASSETPAGSQTSSAASSAPLTEPVTASSAPVTSLTGSLTPVPASPADAETSAKAPKESQTTAAALPPSPVSARKPISYIGVDKAKTIATGAFGLTPGEVTFTTAKLENEGGEVIYDLEFYTSRGEYECEIQAETGEVLEKSVELFAAPVPQENQADISAAGSHTAADPPSQDTDDSDDDDRYDADDSDDDDRYDADDRDDDGDDDDDRDDDWDDDDDDDWGDDDDDDDWDDDDDDDD